MHFLPRRVATLVLGLAVTVPVAFAAAGPGRADPTLTIDQAQAQISALQSQEDGAVEAYNQGRIASTAAQAQARAAQAQVVAQQAHLQVMYAGIRTFAIQSYMTGGIDPLTQMLAGGDPETFLQRAGDLDQVAHNQQLRVEAVRAQAVLLAKDQKTAQQRVGQAADALTALAASRDHIQTLISQQQAVLSHLQAVQRAQLLAQQQAQEAAAAAAAKAAQLAQQKAVAAAAQQAAALARRTAATRRPVAKPAPPSRTPTPPVTPPVSPPTPPVVDPPPVRGGASSAAGLAALAAAETQLGKPYQWGADGPDSYDCSGLVLWAFAHAGVYLPHSAALQYGYGTHVSLSSLQPGDLVFYDDGSSIGHVGIYYGGGEMIDANHTGGWVGIRGLYGGLVGATRI